MADVFAPDKRSRIMARIKGRNTQPELIVRRMIHSMGYRYRLCYEKLPGKPDIALPKYKKVVFVNGCFWHGHQDCRRSKLPSSNIGFWQAKIARTMERDRDNLNALRELGWQVLTVWSCEARKSELLEQKLREFLNVPKNT